MWLTKPDSRPGWAVFFAERGHRVYAPQLPFQGQSDTSAYYERVKVITPRTIENLYTATNKTNDPEWLVAKKHTQWPGVSRAPNAVAETISGYFEANSGN